jgi:(hydroxyamino)benzene mutase
MGNSSWALRQGHFLLRAGLLLFLFALLVGLAVPHFAVPRVGLSAHLLGIMQGLFLMSAGLFWPRLELTRGMARVGAWAVTYGCYAAWAANLLAAVAGAGNAMLPMAAGAAHGSAFQEGVIMVGLRSAAVSLIGATALMLWGLRVYPQDTPKT